MKRPSMERLMELASGSSSSSESSRSSVKDWSRYRSGHNKDTISKLLPWASLGMAQGWQDRGIKTSVRPKDWSKKPGKPKKGGKAK